MTNNKEAGAEQTASIAVAVLLQGSEEGPESSFFFVPRTSTATPREVKLQILLECPMRLGTKLNWQHLMLKFGESCASLRVFSR